MDITHIKSTIGAVESLNPTLNERIPLEKALIS